VSFHLIRESSNYPALLRKIHDPPRELWGEGDLQSLSLGFFIAIVGARECTPYGEQTAFKLAKELAQVGVTVVSGLAYGIDTAAHKGALAGGGKTIGVLGCGIDVNYPAGNVGLRKQMIQNGAVISELAPGTKGAPWTFPQRNRIISGLSRGTVVVEAGLKSGSLITTHSALEQGREVFAVPGNISSPMSEGCHRLIQTGAKLVTGVKDILEEFGEEFKTGVSKKTPVVGVEVSKEEGAVLKLLSVGPLHMDELLASSGLSIEKMSTVLIELEMGGRIKSLPGSRFTLN
jgi:DNA processing protein